MWDERQLSMHYIIKLSILILIGFMFSCQNKDENKTAQEYISAGIRYTEEQKYNKAIASFKKAIEKEPDNALAHYTLGGMYTLKDRNEDAIEEYKKAIELDPGYPDPHYSLGFVYEKVGKKKEAEGEYLIFDMMKGVK